MTPEEALSMLARARRIVKIAREKPVPDAVPLLCDLVEAFIDVTEEFLGYA